MVIELHPLLFINPKMQSTRLFVMISMAEQKKIICQVQFISDVVFHTV